MYPDVATCDRMCLIVVKRMLLLFRAVVKFCSTNRVIKSFRMLHSLNKFTFENFLKL